MIEKSELLEQYIAGHSDPEDDLLAELRRITFLTMLNPRMISGHIQGKILSMLSKMINPFYILEIGTFTGYSAICLAAGLKKGGKIHTIEINDELKDFACDYFRMANLSDKVVFHTGNALEIIPSLNIEFDLAFIDGEKKEYCDYYKCVMPHIKPGGIIIADNVLWDGKVLDKDSKPDTRTKAIMDFNDLVQEDENVENVLFPIRDGLMVIRRK